MRFHAVTMLRSSSTTRMVFIFACGMRMWEVSASHSSRICLTAVA
jgi:hypothetical protein